MRAVEGLGASVCVVVLTLGLFSAAHGQQEKLTLEGPISWPEFRIHPGGALEWPGKLFFSRGSDGFGLPPTTRGEVRAQPGGNLQIMPIGDYKRCALDLYPTQGKIADFDAISEITLHRIHPTNDGHEMLSLSALARSQDKYALVVEAHGTGRIKPFELLFVQGGLLEADRKKEPFWAVPLHADTDGTITFGYSRHGGEPGPVDIINIEKMKHFHPGLQHSDYLKMTAKRIDEANKPVGRADWRANVQLSEPAAQSRLVIQNSQNNKDYQERLVVHDNGDVELPGSAGAVILKSPGGKRFRVTVDDDGKLQVKPAF